MFNFLNKLLSAPSEKPVEVNIRTFDLSSKEAQRTISVFSREESCHDASNSIDYEDSYGQDYTPPASDCCKFLKKELVPLFPDASCSFVRERQSGWFSVVGIGHDNGDGTPRRQQATKATIGEFLYLFWETDNPHDKNAVAVFRLPKGRRYFKPSHQVGYIPADRSPRIIEHHQDSLYILPEIRRKYLNNERVYIIITTYVFVSRNDIQRYLILCKGVGESSLFEMERDGILSYEGIKKASDKELLAIHGIGPAKLSRLRSLG